MGSKLQLKAERHKKLLTSGKHWQHLGCDFFCLCTNERFCRRLSDLRATIFLEHTLESTRGTFIRIHPRLAARRGGIIAKWQSTKALPGMKNVKLQIVRVTQFTNPTAPSQCANFLLPSASKHHPYFFQQPKRRVS